MSVEIIHATQSQGIAVNSSYLNIGIPANVQDDDLLVMVYENVATSAATPEWPAGTTQISVLDTGDGNAYLGTRPINASDASTVLQVRGPSSARRAVSAVILRNAAIGDVQSWVSITANVTGTIPSVNVTKPGAKVFAFVGLEDSGNVDVPAGWSVITENDTAGTSYGRTEIWQKDGTISPGASGEASVAVGSRAGGKAIWTVAFESTVAAGPIGDKSVVAGVMTASATAPNAVGRGNLVINDVTADTYINTASMGTNYDASTTLSKTMMFKVPALGPNEHETGATLYLTQSGTAIVNPGMDTNYEVYRINGPWDSATVTANTAPSMTLVRTAPEAKVSGWWAFNIKDADIGYGFAIVVPYASANFVSKEGTSSQRPYTVKSVSGAVSPVVAAPVMTASGALVDPVIAAGTGKSVAAVPLGATAEMTAANVSAATSLQTNVPVAYASALMTEAQVVQTQNPTLEVEPMLASATLTTGGGFESPRTVAAQAMVAEAALLEAGTYVEKGARITSAPMRATVAWVKPTGVNGNELTEPESEDAFFRRVVSLNPEGWTRLNDKGTQIMNRWGLDTNGNRVPKYAGFTTGGVFTGRNDAPEGRHSVYFDGTGMITEAEGVGGVPAAGLNSKTTILFSIRTTKQNQFLMVESDPVGGTQSSSTYPPKELYIKDGKLNYRGKRNWDDGRSGSVGQVWDFQGHIPVADGQWHTVAIVSQGGQFGTGLEIYVDGQLDVRRGASGGWAGYPDFIGSRPEMLNPGTTSITTLPALPSSQNYVGDMSEIVTFSYNLSDTDIARLYYDFMGWSPVFAEPAGAFAFAPDGAKGKGNQKRALYLWWNQEREYYSDALDPVVEAHGNREGTYEYEGYRVFSRGIIDSIRYDQWEGGWYRDEITDERRLFDLTKDVDFGDYDVIMFGDWPDEGREFDYFNIHIPNFQRRYETLVEQILDKVAEGKGLLVSQPRLAVELGIIDRAEKLRSYREGTYDLLVGPGHPLVAQYGNAAGLYDYGSAVKFPWDIAESAGMEQQGPGVGVGQPMNTDPNYLKHKAHFFADMNWNNRFRVVGLMDGITDIESWMIEDSAFHVDKDIWGDSLTAFKFKDARDGLRIGDSFVYNGTDAGAVDYLLRGNAGNREAQSRVYGMWATPLGSVKAGTVLTTFDNKFWHGEELIDNPYKDYATSIVLREGDTLRGRTLAGRVYVNFTEGFNLFSSAYYVDVLPGSEWDKDGTAKWAYGVEETPEQKQWQFSESRMKAFTTGVMKVAGHTIVIMPDGSQEIVRTSVTAQHLFSVTYSALYDKDVVPVIQMIQRGIWWIGNSRPAEPGGKSVGASPMIAQAKMGEAVLYAERDGGYTAQPAVALAQMTRVKESTIGDVEIHTLPATASATFTGFNRTISPVPMTATAEFPENLNMVFATGEQVVLTLHGVDTTLYLKEEA